MIASMERNLITLYGIPNCDTIKKARIWLDSNGLDYRFFDFKKQGVPSDRLIAWIIALGWQPLLNIRGTTWRKLDESTRSKVSDASSAHDMMVTHPSLIKRPVVEWTDASLSIGFDEASWHQRINPNDPGP